MLNKENIITKYVSGNATAEEVRQLQQWITEDPEVEKAIESAQLIWKSAAASRKEVETDVNEAWGDFVNRVTRTAEIRKKRPVLVSSYRIAAAVLLILATVLMIRFFTVSSQEVVFSSQVAGNTQVIENKLELPQEEVEEELSIITPDSLPPVISKPGKMKRSPVKYTASVTMIAVSSNDSAMVFTLPDNSKVFLNRFSKITYPEDFNGANRIVHLTGEAYIESAHGFSDLFVYCNEIKTRALGSAFNINGLEGDNVEITALEGLVEVTKKTPSETRIIIGKNEKVVYNAKSESFMQSKAGRKTKWWKHTSFRQMVKDFFSKIIHKTS
jgi:transmembrane sensor